MRTETIIYWQKKDLPKISPCKSKGNRQRALEMVSAVECFVMLAAAIFPLINKCLEFLYLILPLSTTLNGGPSARTEVCRHQVSNSGHFCYHQISIRRFLVETHIQDAFGPSWADTMKQVRC